MNKLIFLSLFVSSFCFAQSVEVDVTLSPAGSFVAKTTEVSGQALMKDGVVAAKNIKVNLKSLKTGVGLRDKHTQNYLETEKYPEAVLLQAKGKGGKGKAKIKLRGQEKIVDGTYTVSKDKTKLNAKFPLVLSDLGITGIKYMGVGVKDEVIIRIEVPLKEISSGNKTAQNK